MNAPSSGPSPDDAFDAAMDDALNSLPEEFLAAMENIEIVIEDEPPEGQRLLGLYRGVSLPRRNHDYSRVLPDEIIMFRGPLTRLAAGDADRLHGEVRRVLLHEIAHYFGISDERLKELHRY
jgi:predicted Zn-dependent protease with MMP-like domain